ncbi:MAG: hypothetical protein IT428_15185 [Planctomycetaceae bacterium]|nr:hypothetical protein [Planctomycetaceae bacterium]
MDRFIRMRCDFTHGSGQQAVQFACGDADPSRRGSLELAATVEGKQCGILGSEFRAPTFDLLGDFVASGRVTIAVGGDPIPADLCQCDRGSDLERFGQEAVWTGLDVSLCQEPFGNPTHLGMGAGGGDRVLDWISEKSGIGGRPVRIQQFAVPETERVVFVERETDVRAGDSSQVAGHQSSPFAGIRQANQLVKYHRVMHAMTTGRRLPNPTGGGGLPISEESVNDPKVEGPIVEDESGLPVVTEETGQIVWMDEPIGPTIAHRDHGQPRNRRSFEGLRLAVESQIPAIDRSLRRAISTRSHDFAAPRKGERQCVGWNTDIYRAGKLPQVLKNRSLLAANPLPVVLGRYRFVESCWS